jgi:2-haloacid dehalogenase
MQRRAFISSSVSALAPAPQVQALLFDVFGTVVDWHGTIVKEGADLNRNHNLKVDWARFALDWRAGYAPAMNLVRTGQLPWTRIDALHRRILDTLLPKYGLTHWTETQIDQLNRVWHRLDPWSDSVAGLHRLKAKYTISTLSNGNLSLLTNMAKYAKLPWDCVLSAELFRHYKPDPEAYLGAAAILDLKPNQVMMVAAHAADLEAASRAGLHTAFVHRPLEKGGLAPADTAPNGVAYSAKSFLDLATYLGA